MANNRMYLVFKPSGRKIMIAKRGGAEWTAYAEADKLDKFFEECFDDHACADTTNNHPDDFAIELEISVVENTPVKI